MTASCRLQLAGDQPTEISQFTALHWADPMVYETNDHTGAPEVWAWPGMFDVNYSERIVAPIDGIYRFWASVKFAKHSRGRRLVGVSISEAHTDVLASGRADPGGTTSMYAGIDLPLLAGQWVTVWVEQTGKAGLSVVGHSAKDTTVGLAWASPLVR